MSNGESGTAARLTALYEEHAADAFRYALHLTGRREDAEDVVQYVFLQAYATLEAGRELVSPRAWLIKATKHRSLNLLRDRHDTPAAEVYAADAFAVDPAEAEELADVRASLWSLPEPQHHAFVLRHWSGLSQDEIADVLATTPGAVESLLVRARTTLVAEHDAARSECAGVRERLVRLLAPTPAHEAHLASCHRCRTAQSRLLRASGFAAALVPGPQVAHALSAAVPGFGAHGAAAGAAATGAGAAGGGAGAGGAAFSTASVATKASIAAKIAVAATTAAVAISAVHPVRSAVTHALLGAPAPRAAAGASHHAPAAHARMTGSRGPGATYSGGASSAGARGPGHSHGNGRGQGKGAGAPTTGAPGNGAGKGKSGTAGSNGNGNGQAGGGAGGANGTSASAPGRTKAPGSNAATGKGQGTGQSNGNRHGKANGAGNSASGASGSSGNAGGNGKGNAKS